MSDADSSAVPVEESKPLSPNDVLPPVEPPGVAFLIQLFLIPLLIVSMIVVVWLLFSWMAHAGSNPREIVKEIQEGHGIRWQRAMTLASMLDHSNAQYDELRHDTEFAKQLDTLLRGMLKNPPADGKDGDEDLELRYYICRAVGQLETTEALSSLLEAAITERDSREVVIRLGALESITVMTNKLGAEKMLENPKVIETLLECSRSSDANDVVDKEKNPGYRPHAEIRSVAAYALGVLGSEAALNRLAELLDDGYPTTRYNAATGLARVGDRRAVEVVLEMLDPENKDAVIDERRAADQEIRRRNVMMNGLEAARRLMEKTSATESAPLRKAVENLSTSSLPAFEKSGADDIIHRKALEVLRETESKE
jgi:HEAT repeats